MPNKTIEISTLTILKVFAVAIGLLFLWYIRNILVILFVVAILVAVFSPFVEKLYKKRVPRILSVLLIYLILILIFAFLIYLIVPPIITQVRELTHNLPGFLDRASPVYNQFKNYLPAFQKSLDNIASTLNRFTSDIWVAAITIFGGIISFLTILVLTFYILLERESIENLGISFMPTDHRERILRIIRKSVQKIGAWVRGQLSLCLFIAVFTFIILSIFNIPYALLLAVLAGVLELIPTIGPILSAVPAILLALTISPVTALIVGLLYLGLQQVESQVLVPKILGKVVGLSPIIVIIALLIGAKLLGIAGAILAIPVAATVQVLVSDLRTIKK